jgi:uncharacterized membrane protein
MIQIDSDIWYFPRPMGQNTLGNLMPMAAEECGMDRKTNHSVRKTTIKTLRKAGVGVLMAVLKLFVPIFGSFVIVDDFLETSSFDCLVTGTIDDLAPVNTSE